MPVGDAWEFTLEGVGNTGEQLINVLHFAEIAPTTGSSAAQVPIDCADLVSAMITQYLAMITTGYHFRQGTLRSLTGYSPDLVGVDGSLAGTAGGDGNAAGPIERCGLIQKLTGLAGRRYHGRMFTPMPRATMFLTDGSLNPGWSGGAAFAAFIAIVAATITLPSGLVLSQCIFHPDTGTQTFITNMQVGQLCGAQRRRRFGQGA